MASQFNFFQDEILDTKGRQNNANRSLTPLGSGHHFRAKCIKKASKILSQKRCRKVMENDAKRDQGPTFHKVPPSFQI